MQEDFINKKYSLGCEYFDSKKYSTAESLFSEVIDVDDKHIDSLMGRAKARKAQGKFEEALADYDRLIELLPESAIIYNNKANILFKMEDFLGAVNSYDEAIRLDPTFQIAIDNRIKAENELAQEGWNIVEKCSGKIKEDDENFDHEYAVLNKLLILKPADEIDWYKAIANYKFIDGNYKQAIEYFTKVLSIDDKEKYALSNRGIAYTNISYSTSDGLEGIECAKKAIDDFSAYLKIKNDDAYIYENRRDICCFLCNFYKSSIENKLLDVQLRYDHIDGVSGMIHLDLLTLKKFLNMAKTDDEWMSRLKRIEHKKYTSEIQEYIDFVNKVEVPIVTFILERIKKDVIMDDPATDNIYKAVSLLLIKEYDEANYYFNKVTDRNMFDSEAYLHKVGCIILKIGSIPNICDKEFRENFENLKERLLLNANLSDNQGFKNKIERYIEYMSFCFTADSINTYNSHCYDYFQEMVTLATDNLWNTVRRLLNNPDKVYLKTISKWSKKRSCLDNDLIGPFLAKILEKYGNVDTRNTCLNPESYINTKSQSGRKVDL